MTVQSRGVAGATGRVVLKSPLLTVLCPANRRFRGLGRCYEDDLAFARVMELFAGFFFDGVRIGFQLLDAVGKLRVFLLQAVDFALQIVHLGALLVIHNDAIRTEHGMENKSADKEDRQDGAKPAPLSGQPNPDRARLFDPTGGYGLCARRLPHNYADAVFRPRQNACA